MAALDLAIVDHGQDVAGALVAAVGGYEDRLGRAVPHFSFPKGRATRRAERASRATGYTTAVVTGQRWNGRRADLHHLYRLRVEGTDSLADFERTLTPP